MAETPPEPISLLELEEAALAAITTIRDEMQHLFAQRGTADPFSQTVTTLAHFMSSRSQAVCMLTTWRYPWDAEIVLRSFYETCVKLLYVTLSPEQDRDRLVEEFWIDFDAIHSVRHARKAGYALELRDPDDPSNEVFEALRDPHLHDPMPRANKAKRKEIEQRWSFTEIVGSLSKFDISMRNLQHVKALLHTYGLASHLIHGDKTALDLMMDRQMRPEPERSIVEAAQVGRIFSDLVYLWFFCADAIRVAYQLSFKDEASISAALEKVDVLGRPFATMFQDSQKAFYDRLRTAYNNEPT